MHIFAFFRRRAHRKFISELRFARHQWDDLLTADDRKKFDLLIDRYDACGKNGGFRIRELRRRAAADMRQIAIPDPHPGIRGFLDLILVVGAVAFGIRGLFLQPFQIPTGSMQPTLYGIHYQYAENATSPHPDKLPPWLNAALFGQRRAAAVVRQDGFLDPDSIRDDSALSGSATGFLIGGAGYRLPGSPDKVVEYTNLDPGRFYRRGDTLADGSLSLGDHLFVERISLYLRGPRRGDITVFTTRGLSANGYPLSELSGFFYVKRLVGLPGDTLKIENNQLLVMPEGSDRFLPIAELSEKCRKLYSGNGGYQGHINDLPGISFLLPGTVYKVPEDHYFMLGDNSRFSLDSRFFGAVPRRNLIGRAWLVFWPFSRRWGTIDTKDALPVPTGDPGKSTFPVMYRQ